MAALLSWDVRRSSLPGAGAQILRGAALECAASASPLKVWSMNDGLGLRSESARTGEIVPTLLCLSSRQGRAGIGVDKEGQSRIG